MQRLGQFIDDTVFTWLRHAAFLLVRGYYALFFSVSCSNRHLLQDLPGGLILATHVSRHDGPLLAAILYSTMRVRPAVHYKEYTHPLQRLPMMLAAAIPMSSPKSWPAERRAAQKAWALERMRAVIDAGHLVLLFPAGGVRRQPEERIQPHLSGAYETLKAIPDCPVALIRIEGLSAFEAPIYDRFWTFIRRKKGRRHVNIRIELVSDLKTDEGLAAFNADLERRLNAGAAWPLKPGLTREHSGLTDAAGARNSAAS